MSKAYFVIPDYFFYASQGVQHRLTLESFAVGGVETLTADYFAQQGYSTTADLNDPLATYDFAECNVTMTTCNANTPYNSWNPFKADLGLDFATVGGFARGQATGVTSGSSYGAGVLTIGVDKTVIDTGEEPQNGSFFIDFDETQDLKVVGRLYRESGTDVISQQFLIRYSATNCQVEYHQTDGFSSGGNDWLSRGLGWLGGGLGVKPIEFQLACDTNSDIYGIRSRSYAVRVQPATQPVTISSEECCFSAPVLADTSGLDYQNDYNSFWHKLQVETDTCDFRLVKDGGATTNLVDNTYGTFYDTNSNLIKAYMIEWSKVLAAFGEGHYKVEKVLNESGITQTISSNYYNLLTYSNERAKGTVRLDSVQNGLLEHYGANFAGLSLPSSIRVRGMFGYDDPEYTLDNLVGGDYSSNQVSIQKDSVYKFETRPIPNCLTEEIYDYHIMANKLYVNDYNPKNHNTFVKHCVVFDGNEGTNHYATSIKAKLNLRFRRGVKNVVKRNV